MNPSFVEVIDAVIDQIVFPEFYIYEGDTSADKSFDQEFAQAQEEVGEDVEDIETLYHKLEDALRYGLDGDLGLIYMSRDKKLFTFGPVNLMNYAQKSLDFNVLMGQAIADGFAQAQTYFTSPAILIGGLIRFDDGLRRLAITGMGKATFGHIYY